MKYSFIVPIYNVEMYLERCVNSLLAQTYKGFEIILIDDGSTDSSGDIADMYARKWPESIIVKHQMNMGLGGARNTGISLSRGDYLLMVDSDDHVSEKLLEVVDKYIRQHDNDILIFDYIVENTDGSQKIQRLHDINSYTAITPKQYIFETPAAWNKVYRASLFKDTKISFPERIFYEDLATSPCFAIHATTIGVIKEPLYYYVQRKTSIMHSPNTQRMLEITHAAQIALEYYKQQEKFDEFYQELEYMTVVHVLCSAIQRMLGIKYDYQKIKLLEQFVEAYFPDYRHNFYVKKFVKESGDRKSKWIIKRRYGSLFLEYMLKKILRNIMVTIKKFFKNK